MCILHTSPIRPSKQRSSARGAVLERVEICGREQLRPPDYGALKAEVPRNRIENISIIARVAALAMLNVLEEQSITHYRTRVRYHLCNIRL